MKIKILIISIIIIILLIVIIGGILLWDLTKIIEQPTIYAYNVGNTTSNNGTTTLKYSLEENGNSYIFTLYGDGVIQVKSITKFILKNDDTVSVSYERHYTNKYFAIEAANGSDKDIVGSLIRKDNVNYITDTPEMTKQEMLNFFETINTSPSYEKVDPV